MKRHIRLSRLKILSTIVISIATMLLVLGFMSVLIWAKLIFDYASASGHGDFPLAVKYIQQSVDLAAFYGEAHNPLLLYSVEHLGTIYEARRKFTDALSSYKRQLALASASHGSDSLPVASALVNVGRIYKKERQFAEAEPYLRKGLKIYEARYGQSDQKTADSLDFLAWAVGNQGRYDEATKLYRQELAITEHLYGKNNLFNASPLVGLGWVLEKNGQFEAGQPFLDRAYDLTNNCQARGTAWLTVALTLLANIYRDHHQYAKAEQLYPFVLAMSDRTLFLQNNLFKADIMQNYAKLLRQLGKDEAANELELEAQRIRSGEVLSSQHD